jgi:hypothetical protein
MNIEDQKIKFVNSSMNIIYDLCDELYEALIDDDFVRVKPTVNNIQEVLDDLKKTFKNEI